MPRVCAVQLQDLSASVAEYPTTYYPRLGGKGAHKVLRVLLACAGAAMVRALRERKKSRIVGA
jgi:hypothetical protein